MNPPPVSARAQRRVFFTKPQFQLVTTALQFPAMVAGFGAGKSEALVSRGIGLKRKYPKNNIAYYLPTFDLVRQIAYPRFEEKLSDYRIPYKLNKSLALIDVEGMGQVIFRTMDSPNRIIGYETADSLVDELDTLKVDDARNVWRKIIARNRQKKPDGSKNTIAVGTTPEGFRFVYEQWGKDPAAALLKGYGIIKASTYTNARNLPDGYIQSLLDLYPANLIAAYLEGEFINLTSGTVYAMYDRIKNGSAERIIPPTEGKSGEYLHVGMDFNVGKMSGIIFVIRGATETNPGDPHAVAEINGVLDTPAMILALKLRFPGHPIIVYPDASGASRKTVKASTSDIALLREAGFAVMVNNSNPAVKDRLLSMNVLFGKRRLRVNVEQCPIFAEALEKQSFDKKGEPDKTTGFDHPNDAGGYFICFRYPVVRPSSQNIAISGA